MRHQRHFFLLLLIISFFGPRTALAERTHDDRLKIAIKAFSDDFYDASLALFNKYVQDFPDSPMLHEVKLYIAKCYYYKNDYSQALATLNQVVKNSPKAEVLTESYYWLSTIYFKGKDYGNSLNYAERIINIYPACEFFWPARYLEAKNYLGLGRSQKAEEILNSILALSPNQEAVSEAYLSLLNFYRQNADHSSTIELASSYLARFPGGRLKDKMHFWLAEGYYASGQYDKALANYKYAKNLNYDQELSNLIYQGLGYTYLAKGNHSQAKSNIDNITDKELRHYSQGVYYFETADHVQALETFNMFLRDNPKSQFAAEVTLSKADLLYEMGRLNDAVYTYRHILGKLNAKEHSLIVNKAHYGLAWCYLKSGRHKEAIDEFKNTLKYTDNQVVKTSSQVQIADVYQETGKFDTALDIYSTILVDYPNTVYADYVQFQIGMCFLKKKELEKAFLALNNLKNNFPSSKLVPQAQYYLAVGYFSMDNYSQAVSLLEDFKDRFPRDSFIFKVEYLCGKSFFNQKKYLSALEVFKKLTVASKDNEIKQLALIDIGNTHLSLRQFNKAEKAWRSFLTKYPDSSHFNLVALYLGGLYEKEKKYTEAERIYQEVVSGPGDSSLFDEALISLGHLYWNEGDLGKAEIYFTKLIDKDTPLAKKARLYLAKLAVAGGDNDKALEFYSQLIESKDSASKVAIGEKAALLKNMKKYREAVKFYRLAAEEGLSAPDMVFSLGLCLERIGKSDLAIEEYFKVIYEFSAENNQAARDELEHYMVKSYFRIAKIHEKQNKIEEAKKVYKKLIDLEVKESKIAKARLDELK